MHWKFYSPPQCCTMQHVSSWFRLQDNFIKQNKELSSRQSRNPTMLVVIKWQMWYRYTHRYPVTARSCSVPRTQGIRNTDKRILLPTLTACLAPGGIWFCRARARWRLKEKRHLKHRLSQGERNLISSPTSLVLFHSGFRFWTTVVCAYSLMEITLSHFKKDETLALVG